MLISPHDPYLLKKKKLDFIPPQFKTAILEKLSRGESVDVTTTQDIKNDSLMPALTELMKTRKIDLTKHEDLYYSVNRRLIPLRKILGRPKYDPYRKHAKTLRKLNQENNGFSDGKQFRHIAAFPPEVYHAIQEQYPDSQERDLVIRWLLTKTPEGQAFSTVEGGI